MAARHHSLQTALQSCFSDTWLRETARTHGAVGRQRKGDIARFFWALVLGFSTRHKRTLAQLHRAFELASGVAINRSGFYERFTLNLVAFLKAAVLHAVAALADRGGTISGKLAGFHDLIVADSSVIRLRDALKKGYPACRTNHTQAALKLHVVMSVTGASPRSLQIRGERTHDSRLLRIGPWVKDRLLLFDLGYFSYSLFERIDRNGGYFISRMKISGNPKILSSNLTHRGRARSLVGQRLKEVLPHLKRQALDVMVEVNVTRRAYNGVQRTVKKVLRLVAIYNTEAKRYHTYLTNVPPGDLVAADLTMVVSRQLWLMAPAVCGVPSHRIPPSRWASVFSTVAHLFLCLATERSTRLTVPDIIDTLLRHAVDPNASRRLTMREVAA